MGVYSHWVYTAKCIVGTAHMLKTKPVALWVHNASYIVGVNGNDDNSDIRVSPRKIGASFPQCSPNCHLRGHPTGLLCREMLWFQSHWFIYSFISLKSPQLWSSPMKQGKHLVTVHGAPCRRKTCVQWGVALFPKGIIYDTAVITPVSCSLQHDTFPLGFAQPEPC